MSSDSASGVAQGVRQLSVALDVMVRELRDNAIFETADSRVSFLIDDLLVKLMQGGLEEPSKLYFSRFNDEHLIALESAVAIISSKVGTEKTMPQVVEEAIRSRISALRREIVKHREELSREGVSFFLRLLRYLETALDEYSYGGSSALLDYIDRISGEVRRKHRLIKQIAGNPVTTNVFGLISAIAATVAMLQGANPSDIPAPTSSLPDKVVMQCMQSSSPLIALPAAGATGVVVIPAAEDPK